MPARQPYSRTSSAELLLANQAFAQATRPQKQQQQQQQRRGASKTMQNKAFMPGGARAVQAGAGTTIVGSPWATSPAVGTPAGPGGDMYAFATSRLGVQ